MDYLDQQILMKLKENARQSASDISKEIHLSVSTVIDRIRKMESSGVIESYTVITDEKKTGNDVLNIQDTTNFSLKTSKRIQISSPAIISPENLIIY